MVRITIRGLIFSYDSVPALRDVNLEVGEGEVLSIIGPNGSGKSTLLKCIDRILKPVGTILIDGKELESLTREEIARTIGYIPQIMDNPLPMRVFEMILMGRKPYIGWKPSSRDLKIVSEVIDLLGLEDLAMRYVKELSGGERQKALIARALAQEPNVLLLDEPTSNLDLRHQLEVLDLIKGLAKKGLSVIMAMHDLNLAAKYSDKIAMLKEGRVYAIGGLEVLTPQNIELVYGVKVSIVHRGDRIVIIPEKPVSPSLREPISL